VASAEKTDFPSRSDAEIEQRNQLNSVMKNRMLQAAVLLFVLSSLAQAQNVAQQRQAKETPVETFQVLELPLNITDVKLEQSEKGFLLQSSLANSSTQRILGFRYLLLVTDGNNAARSLVSREEGCKLDAHANRSVEFRITPPIKLKKDSHVTLIIEQVTGEDSIWEVVRAKQALLQYASGDYSTTPKVLQVSNQVDAPPQRQVIYQLDHR